MADHAHAHAHPHDHPHVHGHVSPLSVYLTVFGLLMVLTAVTVIVAYFNFGAWNKVIALSIASFKATVVVLYFMHVKYASRLTQLFAVTGMFFLIIMFAMTMLDYGSRMWVNPPALLQ
jgi:cytochrome c oxidase subunit IV